MKKITSVSITILAFVVFAFAQPTTSGTDSLKVVQKTENSKLAKKTIVQPTPPTNWSKIKDLFR
jgi:hypothetical protein